MKHKILWAVVLAFAVAGLAAAQETTTGTIQGEVKDAQAASVPGASVTLTSGQGSKVFTTDQSGRFFAPYLTPGLYTVRVDLTGFGSIEQKNVNVRLGSRLELSFALKVSDVQEVIEVVGSAPVVDMSRTTVGGNLDTATLQHLPVGRTVTQTLYLVPGVTQAAGMNMNSVSIEGASGLNNSYVIDGVNVTNTGFGGIGTYSTVYNSLGSAVTTDFVKETQVKTAGFEAEYGQATGGVINVITQSGTNKIHGAAFGYFRSAGMEASYRQLQTPNGTQNTTGQSAYDFGINLGGPIVQNKLFFFGVYNPTYQTRTVVAPPNFPLASQGEVDQNRHSNSYAGKLTWQASKNHRFDLSFFGDPSVGDSGPQRTNAMLGQTEARFSELTSYGGHNQSFRYDGIISPKWLIEASFAHAQNSFTETPSVNEYALTDRTVVPNRVLGGIGFYEANFPGTNTQYNFKSTHLFNGGGNHQIRYGVSYEDITFTRGINRTGPTFTLPNGVQTVTGGSGSIRSDPTYGVIYNITRANFSPPAETNQQYLSLFFQDTWQIGKRLTLIPGLRWDRQHLQGGDPATSDLVPELCFEGDSEPGAGNGTGPAIPCSFTWDNNWAYRLGATFDVLGNGKSKLFVNFGRFYVKVPNDLASRAMSADAGITRADYFDAALTRPVPNGVLALGTTNHFILAGVGAAIIREPATATYTEEFLGGFEFELGRANNLGIRYIHRKIPVILEDTGNAAVVAEDIGCTNLGSIEYVITNISPSIQRFTCTGPPAAQAALVSQASFEDPQHTYNAVELTFNRAFTGSWGIFFSYRWAQLKGNYEGFFRSDNGQSDPAITSLFDFPTNDPSYTQLGSQYGYRGDIRYEGSTLGVGVLPNDRPNSIKLYPTYSFKQKLNLAIGLNWGSGTSLTALAGNPAYANNGEVPETVRGGGILTVDGFKTRAPAVAIVDFHADYRIKLKQQAGVVLAVDIFNLFNTQTTANYDNYTESTFGTLNPNYGQPTNGGISPNAGYLPPLSTRLGIRFEW